MVTRPVRKARRMVCSTVTIGDLVVEVVRKEIRNVRIQVLRTTGRVRISVPMDVADTEIQWLLRQHMTWIYNQLQRSGPQPQPVRPQLVTGERHRFMGREYPLVVTECPGPPRIALARMERDGSDGSDDVLALSVPPGTVPEQRAYILQEWYRSELKRMIPELLAKWEPVLGVQASAWGIKRMKTLWGSCNVSARRVWFNLELAKQPLACVEYVVVHELAHLLERSHGAHFHAILDRVMPEWRQAGEVLRRTVTW
jgi:predicted metal-dependent hydrolase